ncbi:MAG TPA: alanine racemase, partial [Pseudomonadales bacterium]|nr:alanine racemase [Pseudomonadales bacterium]
LTTPLFERAGVDAFGVATVDEGIEIRRAGATRPILVLTGAGAKEIDAVVEHQLGVAVLDRAMVEELRASLRGRRLEVHLKIDTGMGRVGTRPDELPALFDALRAAPELSVVGVFSHFANADGSNEEFAASQSRLFDQAVALVQQAGWNPPHIHMANSAAALTRPTSHYTMIRPGIALYGVSPMPGCPSTLRPAMRLATRIVQLKSVPAEYPLSYGQTFVTRRPSRIATLPIGYADGYDRRLSNRGSVLVRGRRAPVVGTICMDLTLIDVTDVPGVAEHDEVVLWGDQDGARIGVDEVAAWQRSVSYEVLTRVGKRVPRVLLGN